MSSELVAVELQLKGYEGVMSDMRALDRMLNGFRGKKNRIEIENNLAETRKEVIALQGEINKLNSVKLKLDEQGKSSEALNNRLKETRERLRDAQQAVKEFQYALKNLSGKSFKQAFDWISSRMAHLGSAMQSAGNALTRLTTPFARFTSGMVMGAGYKALNKFTEGLESGFSRADTMRKYTRLMAEYETANYTAEQSRKDLDESVQGLPIALDDAVSLAQRYTLSLGDMERGTKLAIATNNAFLASMSTENQRYQGMLQMQDLLNGKDLNSREWMSLGSSMGKAINEIGLKLGYGKDELGEFRQELYAGHIATEDFLDALEAVGTGEGSLVKLAQESANTWEAFFSRIATASSRMVYGILTSMDELVNTASGGKFTTLNALFDDYLIGNIDKMTKSIQGWIKAHPEEIIEFGKALKDIRWGSIIQGFGQGLQEVAKAITAFSKAFGGADLSWIGRWMVRGNILGNVLTILGGLIKGSRGLIAGAGASLFKGVQTIKNIRKAGGLAGWLSTLTLGDNPKKTEEAIETVAKSSGKMGKFSTGLSSIFRGWTQVATIIGGSAFVAWGSMKLIKNAIKDFKETVDVLNTVDWDMGAKALGAMGVFFGAMAGLSAVAGKFVSVGVGTLIGEAILGAFTTIASGVAALDMHLLKSAVKSFADLTEYLNQGIENLNNIKSVNEVGGVKYKVQNAITTFNQIIDMFQEPIAGGERNNPVTGDAKQSKLKKLSGDVVKTVSGLKESLDAMLDSVKTLNEISQVRVNIGGLTATIPKIKVGLEKIGNMLSDLPEGMGSDGTAKNASNMASAMQNLKTGLSALVGENGILTLLPTIAGRMAKIQRSGEIDKLNQQMDVLGRGLQQMMNSLNFGANDTSTLLSDMTNISSAVDQIKQIISKLNGIGKVKVDTAGTDNIKTIIQNLKSAFDEAQATELSGQIIALVASVEAALAMFESLNTDIEINPTVKLGGGFKSSVKSSVKQIRGAKGEIEGAINSIPRNYYRTVTVHVAVKAIVSGTTAAVRTATSGANAIADQIRADVRRHSATGGRISRNGVLYRSKGGSIFKPRGTDTIPAMLSEGEYVQRKQAVDFFGVDFMRKINNMDVRGAMQALLNKAGSATNIGRQSVVNNTVNNNQRITQNISTNNPSFAKARMSRFAGAL